MMLRKLKRFILRRLGILSLLEHCDKLEKNNANLHGKITALEKKVVLDADKWKKANQEIENRFQSKLAELDKGMETYRQEVKYLTRKNEECHQKLNELQKKTEDNQQKFNELQKKTEDNQQKFNELQKKNEEQQVRLNELNKKAEEDLQKIKALERQMNAMQYRVAALERKSQDLSWKDNILKNTVNGIEKVLLSKEGGVNKETRSPRVIVSLTSFPGRISFVPMVLQRVLMQTFRADKVVLWLSEDQFLNREADLPDELLQMKAYGVEIRWCSGDIKAYKKILPALKEYPDDLIVIVDDDLEYRVDFLEKLYEAHLEYPQAIIASRVHQIVLGEDRKIAPYEKWEKECVHDTYQMKTDWFFTGGAGTLIPPHVFGEEVFNESVIQALCPYADDIWLNINAAMKKTPIVNIAINNECRSSLCIEGTQDTKLYDINREQNTVQLKKVLEYYCERLVGTIYYTGDTNEGQK